MSAKIFLKHEILQHFLEGVINQDFSDPPNVSHGGVFSVRQSSL